MNGLEQSILIASIFFGQIGILFAYLKLGEHKKDNRAYQNLTQKERDQINNS